MPRAASMRPAKKKTGASTTHVTVRVRPISASDAPSSSKNTNSQESMVPMA